MHRVLSFQMARGFGESSEFVTKRMCFSFLISVGFLSLLCGFLTGRFAAGRAIDIKAERLRLQLAGNGLQSNEHIRQFFMQKLHESPFSTSYVTNRPDEENVRRIKNTLLELEFFHSVVENRSCIEATMRGTHEPDRYVVLSAINEGITVVLELSKAIKLLKDDYHWNPRRTIIFVISLKPSDEACCLFSRNHFRARVVAHIELDLESISENGYFVTSGSDFVLSSILQASEGVKNPNGENQLGDNPIKTESCRDIVCLGSTPRLRLDVPSALITFVSANNSSSQNNSTKIMSDYRRSISEIIGTSVWRLSEMTLFKWDPRENNGALINILQRLNSSMELRDNAERAIEEIHGMTKNTGIFNDKIEQMDTTKSVEVRVANDLSMQVRRLILCNDEDSRSITDPVILKKIIEESPSSIANHLRELSLCYKIANELLQENLS